jgi:hypothetical protein
MQFAIHYFLHLVAPVIIAVVWAKQDWLKVYLLLLSTMIIDVDHLLANPVYDPCRCSIGFHPLHTWQAAIVYTLCLLVPHKYVRYFAVGCLFHLLTDLLDCYLGLT